MPHFVTVHYFRQGSVATHLRCGGIFSILVIANCIQNVPVKELGKSVSLIFGKDGIFIHHKWLKEQKQTIIILKKTT